MDFCKLLGHCKEGRRQNATLGRRLDAVPSHRYEAATAEGDGPEIESRLICELSVKDPCADGDRQCFVWNFTANDYARSKMLRDVFVGMAIDGGRLLPAEIISSLEDAVGFTSRRAEDKWVALLWRQTRYDRNFCSAELDFFRNDGTRKFLNWSFDPFSASIAVIEQCGLNTDSPHLPEPSSDDPAA